MDTLDMLSSGEIACIISLQNNERIKNRLTDMGVIPGADVTFIRCAPLGDPLEYHISGYRLCLRKSEAKNILCVRRSFK